MRYPTEVLGEVEVRPRLNDAEIDYLTAFARTRRWFRPQGPYVVLGPDADETYDDLAAINRPWPGEPSLACDWVPCDSGRRMCFNGRESFARPAEWLRYLIDTFLGPQAIARSSGEAVFERFTFDHVLNGVFALRRSDTGRLWLIQVDDNVVTERELVPAATAA
jgi:hypothetical protein